MHAKTRKLPLLIILCLLIGLILIIIAPDDRELGSMLKLIYLHGALTNTGLFLFTLAGLIGLVALFRNIPLSFLYAFMKTAIVFWVIATIMGNIASQIVWGGLVLSEPRFQNSILIAILSISVYFISTAVESTRVKSLLGIGLAAAVWIFMSRAGRILHPVNPFSASDYSIQLFYSAITLTFTVTSILIAVWIEQKS